MWTTSHMRTGAGKQAQHTCHGICTMTPDTRDDLSGWAVSSAHICATGSTPAANACTRCLYACSLLVLWHCYSLSLDSHNLDACRPVQCNPSVLRVECLLVRSLQIDTRVYLLIICALQCTTQLEKIDPQGLPTLSAHPPSIRPCARLHFHRT